MTLHPYDNLGTAVDHNQQALFGDYRIGLEILVLNGALTFAGLWLVSKRADA